MKAVPLNAKRRPTRGQGRIYLRGEIWWIAYSRRGHEFRESAKTTDESKAWRLLDKRLKEREQPDFVGPNEERLMLEDLERAIEAHYLENNKTASLATAKHCLKRVKDFFPYHRLVDITTERVDEFKKDRLAEGAERSTVNRHLAYLRLGFNLLVEKKQISAARVPTIRNLEGENVREGFINVADFEAIMEKIDPRVSPAALDLIRFLYNSGWRSGAARTLPWRYVDMEERLITLPNTGDHGNKKKARVLSLSGELWEILERRLKDRRPDCLFVFHRNGKPIKTFRRAWDSACTDAGRPGLVPHDMRRSAIRNFRKAGVPETVGMALSGHRTNSVFKRYDIIDTEDVQQAVAKVQSYLQEQKRTAQAKVVPLRAAR